MQVLETSYEASNAFTQPCTFWNFDNVPIFWIFRLTAILTQKQSQSIKNAPDAFPINIIIRGSFSQVSQKFQNLPSYVDSESRIEVMKNWKREEF